MATYHSVKPERKPQEIILDVQNTCGHKTKDGQKIKLIVSPIWITEGTLDIATIHCQECDAFLAYVTRKHPIIPQVDTSSTLRVHQLTNVKFPIRLFTLKKRDNEKLN
jgi:hypothetical protein